MTYSLMFLGVVAYPLERKYDPHYIQRAADGARIFPS